MISVFKFVHKNKKGMSMKILKTAAVAMCIALPFQAFAESAKDDAVTETTVVATVNGKPIYYGDVVMLHDSHPQLSRLPLKDLFNPLLDNVIDTTLAYNAAVKEKLNADPKVETFGTDEASDFGGIVFGKDGERQYDEGKASKAV